MYRVEFTGTLCKGCSLCAKICPAGIIVRVDRVNDKGYRIPEIRSGADAHCTGCQLCAEHCLEGAIQVYPETPSERRCGAGAGRPDAAG